MTLREISAEYRASAQTLRLHLQRLRRLYRQTEDREESWRLKMRIARYTEMLTLLRKGLSPQCEISCMRAIWAPGWTGPPNCGG